MQRSPDVSIERLGPLDRDAARTTFALMARVFGEGRGLLSDPYLDGLLAGEGFWAFAAQEDGTIVGGLTAHTLPMTRDESAEVFIYDIAVDAGHQRRGHGRRLVEAIRRAAEEAGIDVVFVPADDDDEHALDFYRALGGVPSAVTFFDFPAP